MDTSPVFMLAQVRKALEKIMEFSTELSRLYQLESSGELVPPKCDPYVKRSDMIKFNFLIMNNSKATLKLGKLSDFLSWIMFSVFRLWTTFPLDDALQTFLNQWSYYKL